MTRCLLEMRDRRFFRLAKAGSIWAAQPYIVHIWKMRVSAITLNGRDSPFFPMRMLIGHPLHNQYFQTGKPQFHP
jgi:hypothetical protein